MIFQSTLRRTERPYFCSTDAVINTISIHAPTNGATELDFSTDITGEFQSTLRRTERLASPRRFKRKIYFNPRSDERSDQDSAHCPHLHSAFQSTLRRTERPLRHRLQHHRIQFQSTLRRTERLGHSGVL